MKNKRFLVIGLGEFGRALAPELTRLGAEVLAVDISTKRVAEMRDQCAMTAVADVRDKAALEELITTTFDIAIVAIGGSLESSIMATLHLKELAVGEIWVEANSRDRAEVLRRVGADHVISPEQDLGQRLAHRLVHPNLVEFLPLTEGYGVVRVEAPQWTHGKSLADLELRRKMNVTVIAVHSADGNDAMVPGAQTVIGKGDELTLVGSDKDLVKFRDRED